MNVVQKYSGHSIDSIADIKALAQFIAANKAEDDGMVIVVGSMASTIERLEDLAFQAGDIVPQRELDALLTTGEQQTAALLAIALDNAGVTAASVNGMQSGFISNEFQTGARIQEFDTEKVKEVIGAGQVAVVAGSQGLGEYGDVTAVAIAADLGWPCEMYGDADCLYTVDPELYADAKPLKSITYEEMMELAHHGSDVLETRSVELAKKYDVQLFFGKAMESDKSKGTYIMNRENLLVEEMPITGMSIQEDVVIFTLRDISNEGPAVAEAFKMLAEMGINVDMISQQSTDENTCSVSFSCTADQGDELAMAVQENEIFNGATVDMEEGLALISLVGVGMASHPGVASSVFSTLAVNGISFYHITTSEISISVTVDMDNKINAAIALSKAFDL